MQLCELLCAADPADLDVKFEGPPLVGLDPDILGSVISSGIHTRRQDLWDDIWTALSAAGVDVAQPPGIRTDAHDFVRDGLHMSRCVFCLFLYITALCLVCLLVAKLTRSAGHKAEQLQCEHCQKPKLQIVVLHELYVAPC